MGNKKEIINDCCGLKGSYESLKVEKPLTHVFPTAQNEKVCCGPPADPPSGPNERAGYQISHYVEEFIPTAIGPIPRARTRLDTIDHLGGFRVRWGIRRNQYKVAPGLYCMGYPDTDSPVLVSANYKLSFDMLRSKSDLPAAWILVVDTRGINVWCAAGKGSFSTQEVVRQVRMTNLERLVTHRRLILPQLAATGVSALEVKKRCGFKVVWGPVHLKDLKRFMDKGLMADAAMRRVTFSTWERMVLVPVELSFLPKYLVSIIAIVFLLSGIGLSFFSFEAAWARGSLMVAALVGGVLGGTVFTPILLPWIPGSAFSIKGAFAGIPIGFVIGWLLRSKTTGWETVAIVLCTMALSSYLAMNFTGATPYTSPSGVEREMRKAIPLQVGAVFTTVVLWVTAAFV